MINIRQTLALVVFTVIDYFTALISAISWANIILGQSVFRASLLFLGGLLFPILDSKMKRFRDIGGLTRIGALAGLTAIVLEVFITSNLVVFARVFWLDGNTSNSFNSVYALIFIVACMAWMLCFYEFSKRASG
jgi:hypothetical protein